MRFRRPRPWRRAPAEISCQELVELVTDYLDGALPERDRARFEAHIAQCPHCTDYLEQFRLTIATVGRLPQESLSSEATDALLEAFRGWRTA